MLRAPIIAALLALLAGCAEQAPSGSTTPPAVEDDEEWRFGGAWTAEYTQADMDAWCAIAREYGNECAVMESFPPQYGLRFTSEAMCNEARAKVLALENISARECTRIERSDDPDGSTSSPPQNASAAWTLHGTFTQDHTDDDIAAVCEAGTGDRSCAIMKSFPPQYSFRFASREACEEARAKIAAVPHTRPGECREVAG